MKKSRKIFATLVFIIGITSSIFGQWNEVHRWTFTSTLHIPLYIVFSTPDTGYIIHDSIVTTSGSDINYITIYRTTVGGKTFNKIDFPPLDWRINFLEQFQLLNRVCP